MLGEHVVIFPDYGEAFVRSLKTNVLYAKRVTSSILLVPEHLIPLLSQGLESARQSAKATDIAAINRSVAYLDFILGQQQNLRPLVDAGVLSAPDLFSVFRYYSVLKERYVSTERERGSPDRPWAEQFESAEPSLRAHIERASRQMQPSLLDVIPMAVAASRFSNLTETGLRAEYCPFDFGLLSLQDRHEAFEPYLLPGFGAALAMANEGLEESGLPLVCTDPVFQNGLAAAHRIFSSSSHHSSERQVPEELLATTIFQAYLPVVYDLPIDEILGFRLKHEAELDAFRSGVGELAATVDVSQSVQDVQKQCQGLVLKRVDPAVRDLRAKLKVARLESLQKMGKSWLSLANLTFSTSFTVLVGAPLEVGVATWFLRPIVHVLFEGPIEKKKLMHASQWSVLVRFEDLKQD